jgi:PhnB protein
MTTLAPWILVPNGSLAVEFYKSAFGAEEISRVEAGDEIVVARLAFGVTEFWISAESSPYGNGGPIRIILYVDDPDAAFQRALSAGATEVYPVNDQHGWRVGRLVDPFGHHWELGRELVV